MNSDDDNILAFILGWCIILFVVWLFICIAGTVILRPIGEAMLKQLEKDKISTQEKK